MRTTAALRQAPSLPVREMATGMLIAQAMQDEDYAQAQELVDTLSDATPFAVDKEERQAAIYARDRPPFRGTRHLAAPRAALVE